MTAKKKIKIESKSGDNDSKQQKPAEAVETDDKKAADTDSKKDTRKTAADPMKELEEKFQKSEEEAKQSYDRFLRVSAEFENYKKRSAREMEDFRKYANQSLVRELLPVVDNLELAIKSAKENKNIDTSLLDGVDLTLKEILKIFEKFNVKEIEAFGRTFDPRYHEAVMREETDKHPENSITNELQKGYMIHDRLLRPSMVVVAAPRKQEDDKEKDDSVQD